MLGNYLKVTLRTLRRRPGYTAINIGGLAAGLASCLLAYAFIAHERSFDAHHPAAERTYRVNTHFEDFIGGNPSRQAQVPTRLAQRLGEEGAGVAGAEHVAFVRRVEHQSVKAGRQFFEQKNIGYVTPAFFDVFDYRMQAGSARRLSEPGTAVLTESVARRYFGGAAGAVGQSVRLGEDRALEVVGVAADPPARTQLPFELLASYATLASASKDWYDDRSFTNRHYAFVVVREGARPESVEARLNAVRKSFQDEKDQANTAFRLQPIQTLHTTPAVTTGGRYQIDPAQLWALGLVGAIIALLAVVNFVNLATAQASRRAREVGVRKAVGARRFELAAQFMGEAALLTFGAALLGWLAAYELVPLFGRFFGVELARATLTEPRALLFAGGATLLTALLAGAYPALVLSGYRPAAVLKGDSSAGGGQGLRGARLRRGLTIFQLAAAQVLVAGTLVAAWQMSYVQGKDLGFEPEARLTVPVPEDSSGRARFRRAFRSKPGARGVTYVMGGPTRRGLLQQDLTAARAPGDTLRAVRHVPIDAQYLDVYGIELAAGRNMRPREERGPVGPVALVNRAMAERLGFEEPQQALGTQLSDSDDFSVEVVGVTENYHHNSLRSRIGPALLLYWPRWTGYAGIALDPERRAEGLAQVEAAFGHAFPDTHFRYAFLPSYLSSLYEGERRLMRALWVFAALAVFIACLGLVGLAAFAAERRRKEIAVRKVLGATAAQVTALLSKDFLRLVAVGFALAVPLAWYGAREWLDQFAYRIELGPGVFLAAGALALVVALAATGTQALRAARMNPTQALRDE